MKELVKVENVAVPPKVAEPSPKDWVCLEDGCRFRTAKKDEALDHSAKMGHITRRGR